MACSPDGSQSVWKRTLSAALAGAARASGAAIRTATKANARTGCGMRGLLRPARFRGTHYTRRTERFDSRRDLRTRATARACAPLQAARATEFYRGRAPRSAARQLKLDTHRALA